MTTPSEQCLKSISASDGAVLELMAEVTPVLEFMRVSGIDRTSSEAALRDVVDKIEKDPDYDPTLEAQFRDTIAKALGAQQTNARTFVNWLELWVSDNGIPGWDNATCSMNWETYECFCNKSADAFVSGGPDNLSKYLGSFDESDCAEKASILPWVGAGILAIFGVGWLATRKG